MCILYSFLPRSGVAFSLTVFYVLPYRTKITYFASHSTPVLRSCDTLNTAPNRTDGRKKICGRAKIYGRKNWACRGGGGGWGGKANAKLTPRISRKRCTKDRRRSISHAARAPFCCAVGAKKSKYAHHALNRGITGEQD